MNIEDRITNIKKILPYCSRWDDEVMIIDEEVGLFFGKFFNGDKRFKHCKYSNEIYPKISLAKHILTRDENGEVIDEYPIQIAYCYDFDRDGEDWETYYFDEPLVRNNWLFRDDYSSLIKYDEIPDKISFKCHSYNKKRRVNETLR